LPKKGPETGPSKKDQTKNFMTKMATAGARVDSLGTVDDCLLYLQRAPAVLEQVLYTTNRIK
jgi:hypothetical protein